MVHTLLNVQGHIFNSSGTTIFLSLVRSRFSLNPFFPLFHFSPLFSSLFSPFSSLIKCCQGTHEAKPRWTFLITRSEHAENNKNNRVAIPNPKDSFQERLSSARKVIVIGNGGIATELGKQLVSNDSKYF